MQEILKGRECLLRVNIADVGAVQNASKIDTHIISPSGAVSCVPNAYDELERAVLVQIDGALLNELGAYSADMRLVFDGSVIVVPAFAFAEVVENAEPCRGVSVVDVVVEDGEVKPSEDTVVEIVSRKEFDALAESVAKLNGKQDQITVITKENGNIVLLDKEFMPATPSGDPMHYAYEVAGAVWNDETGFWELNGLTDITSDEIRSIYEERLASWTCAMEGLFAYSKARTNFVGRLVSTLWGYIPNNTTWMFLESQNMEVARVSAEDKTIEITNANGMFFRANKLRRILGVIDFSSATVVGEMFVACYALEDVRCANLKQDISFADSPLLSKASLLYMIENCASGANFKITVHPDVYNKCTGEWLEDIDSALGSAEEQKGTNITLAK